jgi:hypothetical protein
MDRVLRRPVLLAMLLMLPFTGFAHDGRTNTAGCHKNYTTGKSHCQVAPRARSVAKFEQGRGTNNCGLKYYCGEMTELDSDSHAIPCETICKQRH